MTRAKLLAAVAAACFATGVLLSHQIEPSVRVESITLAGNTPALQFLPAAPGPHLVALLAHGYSASKESLFCYGEALAAAGFVCFDVDLPGHGASLSSYTFVEAVHTLDTVARAVGPVDVFIGHSMGGFAGGEAVREGRMKPKLVIAVGSLPVLGDHAPPLLFLAGRYDEYFPPALLKTRTDARLVLSPWSDHGLEAWDPILVKAAVAAACAAVGKTPPAVSTRWRWRFASIGLALVGAFGLTLCLPKLPLRWAWTRGPLVATTFILAFVLTTRTFIDAMPHLRYLPLQTVAAAITLLLLMGTARFRIPRWSLLAAIAVVAIGCAIVGAKIRLILVSFMPHFGLVLFLVSIPALIEGTIVGAIAARRGSRFAGDIAMAIIVGCALFQWGQPPRMPPKQTVRHTAIKLDTKLLEACTGHYEFAPDNSFWLGMNLTNWLRGDRLMGQIALGGQNYGPFEIFPESATNFFDKVWGTQWIFIRDERGEVTAVIHHYPGLPESEGKKLKK